MASSANVLRPEGQTPDLAHSLFGSPTRAAYRCAVAQVIRNLKAQHNMSNERLAERLRCSESTVFNAENENGNLDAVTLLTVAFEFGEEAIAPVRELYLCAPPEPVTALDRLSRIEAETAMLRRELA